MKENRKSFLHRIRGALPVFLAAGVFCGCCSAEAPPRSAGSPNGRILAESLCRNNAKGFTAPLGPALKKEFGEKEFARSRKKLCQQMGEPVGKEYIGELKHPFLGISLWRISFERKGSDGKKITQDALFQVVSATEDGEEKVISFGFL